jgi:hypothetical protein
MGRTTWSHEKKLAYMKQTILPAEREIFARFEPLRFTDMTCETCHEQGARDRSYKRLVIVERFVSTVRPLLGDRSLCSLQLAAHLRDEFLRGLDALGRLGAFAHETLVVPDHAL